MTTDPQPTPPLIVVCYAKCWNCQFGEHNREPHTWMDSEDIEAAKDVQMPASPADWDALAKSHPCGCWCLKEKPAEPRPVVPLSESYEDECNRLANQD